MITASLKQTVVRRPKPKPAARFKLLVSGRVRGVWEKRASATTLLRYRKPVAPANRPGLLAFWLERKRAVLFGAVLAVVVLGAAVFFAVWLAPAPVWPLELPAGRSVLLASLSGAEAEDDDAVGDAGPLVLKKLAVSTYKVKAGDSLPSIAKKTKVDVDTLISFNAITDAREVTRGRTLSIPNHPGLRYRVRPGDSLSTIGRRFNVGLDDLLDWNNLPRSVIQAGQTLFIPNGRLGAAAVNRVLGTLFVWPTKGSISSPFGMRISPITGTPLFHNGVDIANNLMTPIVAAAPGRVAAVDYNPTYGNYIILVHDNGYQTLYGHTKEIYVKKGMTVAQGQKMAAMGSTGASTGSHLHFSIFKNGRPVDPLKYLH
jgi:LysM repeat protein